MLQRFFPETTCRLDGEKCPRLTSTISRSAIIDVFVTFLTFFELLILGVLG
jgi:hypothetical protein